MLSALISSPALSFPSNIRLGYTTCAACHVDATGGSLLTPYGRMASADVMSTWGEETEGKLLHGLMDTSERLDIGGDFQYLKLRVGDYRKEFIMQREVQLALNWDRKYTLFASAGLYGAEAKEAEYRRVFLQGVFAENFTLKIGRFMPAFGIMSNEHFYLYRSRYFNQGRETYNAEAIARSKELEFTVTRIFGHPDDFEDGALKGNEGVAARMNFTPTNNFLFGFSYLGLWDIKGNAVHTGAFQALWGPNEKFWVETQAGEKDLYFRLGFAPTKGFMVRPTVEWIYESEEKPRQEINLQWLPRPHFDYQITCSEETWLFLAHYYL